MIITKLFGGLGNQMFQYAAGRRLARSLGMDLELDVTAFNYKGARKYGLFAFNIREKISSEAAINSFRPEKKSIYNLLISNLLNKNSTKLNYFKEKFYHFDHDFLNIKTSTYLDGYWQSEKYFREIKSIIKKEFTLKTPISEKVRDMLNLVKSTDSVSLHVRRGDYCSDPQTYSVHGLCSESYYRQSVSLILEKIKAPHFFIFSDDPDWRIKNIDSDFETTYVNEYSNNNYEDIMLMSCCNNHIIANSSFSWWGAWLGEKEDKIVIAPSQWFTPETQQTMSTDDLYPNNWIKL